jgi:unsaturated chondroitin disaccharide hydrolase
MSPSASSLSRKPGSEPASAVGSAELVHAYAICVEKARRNIVKLADRPKSAALAVDGDYFAFDEEFNDISNWTSSFFTGMALLGFETTKDTFFLQQANRLADAYREKVFQYGMDTMHDLGFLYSLYSVANYKLTGDREHRSTALRAADELAKRFSPQGGYIKAWGRMDEKKADYAGLAIIDCMMNLPLLFWAAQETGNRFYSEIAIKHANTTLRCFIRADDSVYHSYRFDLATGAPLRGDFHCGHGVESHWARGTAWAIYGFALAYGYTRDAKYLEASDRLARKFLSLLDAELVPVWDFRLPKGAKRLRDSSAAAVAICGFNALFKYRPHDSVLAKAADEMLGKLCSDRYLDSDVRCPGVLKDAQIGGGGSRAQNAYTSWGDYFFMEALARKLYGVRGYW